MPELSDLVSFGDDIALQVLSRGQLLRFMSEHDIRCSPDATKEESLMAIKAAGIDITKPGQGIDWELIRGRDELGRDTHYIAPIKPAHQSARSGVDSSAILQRKLSETEDKNTAQADEIKRLTDLNGQLVDLVKRLEAKLDDKDERALKVRGKRAEAVNGYWAKYRDAKARGLPVKPGMKGEEIDALIAGAANGQDAP